MKLRFQTFLDGRMLDDRECTSWAQIGGLISNTVSDVDVIQVKQDGNLVLLYRKNGIY